MSTNCLKLAGVGDYVSVPDSTDLNAFPLTVTAWVKTARNANQVDGIVCKYVDASFNGYALFLLNGHVRAWYFKDNTDYIWDGSLGLDGGFIADNDWHHIAFEVDANGGRLLVDGNQIQTMTWTGAAAGSSGTEPLQIGRYFTFANRFSGQIDETTLWQRSFTANEIQAMLPRKPVRSDRRRSGIPTSRRSWESYECPAHAAASLPHGVNSPLINEREAAPG